MVEIIEYWISLGLTPAETLIRMSKVKGAYFEEEEVRATPDRCSLKAKLHKDVFTTRPKEDKCRIFIAPAILQDTFKVFHIRN